MKSEDIKQIFSHIFKKYKYFFLVIAAGLALIFFSNLSPSAESTPKTPADAFSVADCQRELEEALANVRGVGNISVTLTLKSSAEMIYAEDKRESVSQSENRFETDSQSNLVTLNGSGSTEPVVVNTIYPRFQGALVVCDGADSPSVRYELTMAVAALTGISTQNISILKMKS